MNLIYKFKPKRLIMSAVILSIMFLAFSFGPYVAGGIPLLILYIIFFFGVLYFFYRRKIALFDDRILIIQGFKKRLLNYDDIHTMRIERYGNQLSKVSYPAIMFYGTDERKVLAYVYHGTYNKEVITTMVDFIKSRNAKVKIENDIVEYLR